MDTSYRAQAEAEQQPQVWGKVMGQTRAEAVSCADQRHTAPVEMLSAVGARDTPQVTMLDTTTRPNDDAQMMSTFSADPDAQMMTCTRGAASDASGGMTVARQRHNAPAKMLSAVGAGDAPQATLMDTTTRPNDDAQMMSEPKHPLLDPTVMDTSYRAQAEAEQQPQVWGKVMGQTRAEAVSCADQRHTAPVEMLSAVGARDTPQVTMLDTTTRPNDDAQMMSTFSADPDAQMMTCTRGAASDASGDVSVARPESGAMTDWMSRMPWRRSSGHQPPAQMMSAVACLHASDAAMMDSGSQTGSASRPASLPGTPGTGASARGDVPTTMMSSFAGRDASDATVMDTMHRAQATAEQEPQAWATVTGQIARPVQMMSEVSVKLGVGEALMMDGLHTSLAEQAGGTRSLAHQPLRPATAGDLR